MEHDKELNLVTQTLAEIIKQKRFKLGLSLQELSYQSGVNRSTISRIETLDRQPNIVTLLRLAKPLGIPCWELIKKAEEENLSALEEIEPLILPDEVEKAFLKLRKKCLEKELVAETVIRLAKCIF